MPPIAEDDSQRSAIAEMERVLRENLSAAQRRIQNAVCPIYGVDDRGKPYLIGSSLLLSVGDRLLLVTAAHVLDWNKDTSLYVAGSVRPILIEGDSYRTSRPRLAVMRTWPMWGSSMSQIFRANNGLDIAS